MNKIYSFTLGLLLLIGVVPFGVSAETVLRTGDSISVESDQVVEGDFYVVGEGISMSGAVQGDMYAVGGSITANGTVEEDVAIAGGMVQMHASVTDDVRIVAGEVVVAEHIGGDLFVIAGSLKVLSTATIDGSIFFYGGEAEISGPVGGSIMGTANKIRIDSSVVGSIDVITPQPLELGDRASVGGDIQYQSDAEMVRAQNAVVEGEVLRTTATAVKQSIDGKATLVSLIVTLFATLCLYLVFRRKLQKLVQTTLLVPARSGLIGLGVLIFAPIASVLLMVTVLGLLVGTISMFVTVLLYILSFVLMSVVAGGLIAQIFTRSCTVNLWWILAGALAVQVLLYAVPIIGPFVVFMLFVLTLGGLSYNIFKMFE